MKNVKFAGFREQSKCFRYIQNAPDTFKMLQTHSQRHSKGSSHIQKAPDTFADTFHGACGWLIRGLACRKGSVNGNS